MFYWKKFKEVLLTQLFYYYCYYQVNRDARYLLGNTFYWLSFMWFCSASLKNYPHSQVVACDVCQTHLKYIKYICVWCVSDPPEIYNIHLNDLCSVVCPAISCIQEWSSHVCNLCIVGKYVLKYAISYKLGIWNAKFSDPYLNIGLFLGTTTSLMVDQPLSAIDAPLVLFIMDSALMNDPLPFPLNPGFPNPSPFWLLQWL